MKTYKLNPQVAEIDFTVAINPQFLIDKGWVFDNDLDNYVVEIYIEGTKENYTTVYAIENSVEYYNGISNGCYKPTGDDMKTIEDIIDWLNENKPEQQYMNQDRYRGFWDDSVDFNECYIQAFIQEEEA